MSEHQILDELFNPNARLAVKTNGTRRSLTLVEPSAPTSIAEILDVPADLIAIDLDTNLDVRKLFRSGTGRNLCKRADFILLSAAIQCVVFVELKAGKPSLRDVKRQLKGSLCVFEYCDAMVRHFFDEEFLEGYQKRFVAILESADVKRPVKPQQDLLHDQPDRPLVVRSCQRFFFRQLAQMGR